MERGVLPIGDWSILTILSIFSRPSIALWGKGRSLAPCSLEARALYKISLIKVDLPLPLTPVTTVNTPKGIATSIFFKLLPVAPRISSRRPSGSRRCLGTGIYFLPLRYWPVIEAGTPAISAAVPWATTSPPCSPAPGPMSRISSAAYMVSSSCSTTSRLLPKSRRCLKVSSSLALSRWCRPMLGSSRMYSTPVRPEPIWVASRMRWASPPLKVAAARLKVK